MNNPHEDLSRQIKAQKICEAAYRAALASDLEGDEIVEFWRDHASLDDWTAASTFAGCRRPSPATRQVVLDMLVERCKPVDLDLVVARRRQVFGAGR